MIWRENNFYEPEDNSIGESIMITVRLDCTHPPELEEDNTMRFEVKFSKIHYVILERICEHFECDLPEAVKMLIDAGMQDCLGGIAI